MPTISTNKELLNVINDDVQNVKQFTKMPAISDELYNELLEEFNKEVSSIKRSMLSSHPLSYQAISILTVTVAQ